MANEGIMALPQGGAMPGEEAQNPQPAVTSADSYDAALVALNMTDPREFEAFKLSLSQSLEGVEIPPEQLDTLIYILERLVETPQDYPEFARLAASDGIQVLPEFDPEFVGALLVVLNEMRMESGAMAQEAMAAEPMPGMPAAPAEATGAPMNFAQGGLADAAAYLQSKGRNGDKILAHITPGEAEMLRRRGGAGTINPATGLPEYGWLSKAWNKLTGAVKSVVKGVVNVVKDVLKSPVGRILGTIALATVLGPAGVGLSLGTAAGLAGAGTTLMAGGSIKEALISGALGYVGGGGTIMGVNPVASVGQYLPGAAGSALNTGLATGVLGAGIGKIGGMSTADALKMGLTSGVSAAAMTGLKDTPLGRTGEEQAVRDDAFRRAAGGDQAAADTVRSGDYSGAVRAPGAVGPTGTAQDLLAAGQQPQYTGGGLSPTATAPGLRMPSMTSGPQDFSAAAGGTGATTNYDLVPRAYSAPTGIQASGAMGAMDFSRAAGGTGAATNYGLAPATAASTAPAAAPGFIDKITTGAKNLYNEYLSPSRPGLAADAGLFAKYGPLAAAGLATTAALGGMEGEAANQNPAFNRSYTGSDYMRDNPDKFAGGLSSYTRPDTLPSPVVPTPPYATLPRGPSSVVMPDGITRQPGGIAQPYNMAGLYGVPLIYGPDGQPQRLARGGQPQPTHFPRKQGPIDGPGTGTSDDIPAMLSDGEFVFTAKAVRNAGGGSRRKGASRMYKLMKMLEGGPVKGK